MKIALVHDYLAQDGGAERVLKAFHEIWPEAPIFVLFHKKGSVEGFDNAEIHQSFIGRFPGIGRIYRWLLPLMPRATERHNLDEFDVVLSSTSAFAKGVLTRPNTLHISYCHTPTRYLWTDTHEYIDSLKYNVVLRVVLRQLIHHLRLWDKMSVDRVDHFIANSNTVHQRIEKYYRRDSDVLYPPVDVEQGLVSDKGEKYYISGGRLVSYKRFDLLIHVFNRLGWPLYIFGTGSEEKKLKNMAKENIHFLGRISDEEKNNLLSKAKGFLHPQLEDFGITPIEAMASGCPVIAYGIGGVTETVIPDKTGVFFYQQTWEDLLDTMLFFDTQTWDRVAIQAHAQKFSAEIFKQKIQRYVHDRYEEMSRGLNQCRLDIR
ncbi:glycosyltransferase [Patescibacteria group bacterium]|nr:glycosyltransferase [Patescibacteria group bacterium]MBU1721681.1 glycosyltransferase [Patescibacteria group bacterium]MBU1900990.1 glycosyltransferase [Patescibacteria group bacterium]